ncbi:MAG TPA: hypothetical protein VF469_32925 [Kofleriaceae bacterium]
MRHAAFVLVPISLALSATSLALPPGAERRGFRDGANHHLGDDSFVERAGRRRFYYDTPDRTPIAIGSFSRGSLVGAWRHYDAAGKLLARSTVAAAGAGFGEYLLHVVPGSTISPTRRPTPTAEPPAR